MPRDKQSDPTQDAETQRRCRWQTGTGRCTNTVGTKLMAWGHGKTSWICDVHWDSREELRPASLGQWRAAMLAMKKVQKCGHADPACADRCIHAQEYEAKYPAAAVWAR